MGKRHTVRAGDCIESIGELYGFFPDTLWDYADNKDLREERKNPNTLRPGDVVRIPDKESTEETCAAGERHRFKRKGVPSKLKVNLHDALGQPYASEKYVLDIGGVLIEGTTDGEGLVEESIPPNAQAARIRLPDADMEFELNLGHLGPIDTVRGVRQRLRNLGYEVGGDVNELTDEDVVALTSFQGVEGLDVDGKLTDETRDKLLEVHGC